MTVRADAGPLLRTFGFPDDLAEGSTLLADLRDRDPMGYCLFVLALEGSLSSELPADLLDVLLSVDDLLAFVATKETHAP